VLTKKRQKCFFGSLDELAMFVKPDIKQSMIAWAFAGGQMPVSPPGNWV